MATVVHNRPNNRIHDASFDSADVGRSKTAYETTNFDMSALNNSITAANNYQNEKMQRSKTLPKLSRERSRENKMYRAPPTPPPDRLIVLERSFTLDCIAVGNISEDYSTANPKLGSAIPPYDSRNDPTVKNYMKNYGIDELLKRTRQFEPHESIPGKIHDRFHSSGLGARYIKDRNKFGNGHHPENFEGHRRFLGEELRVSFSYNNMYGYRRNVPRLRSTPSTFTADKRQMQRLNHTYQNHYSQEEIRDHFQNTFVSGFPFHENDLKQFHPNVRYFVTVKVGADSPDQFKDNLNVNIIARSYATGFIQLDKSIAFLSKTKDERAKSTISAISKKSESAFEDQNARDKLKLFQKGKDYIFAFEDKDIRTVSGIILAREGKQDLYVDSVVLEIHKATEKKIFRFPYHGWVNSGKQSKKAEDIKRRFGITNSVYAVPNELPQFEYKIKTSPQIFSKAEYIAKIQCDIEDENAPIQYRLNFHPTHVPPTSSITVKLFGEDGSTDFIKLTDHKLVLRERDIGKIKSALITYDRRPDTDSKGVDWFAENLVVTKANSENYVFKISKSFKAKERIMHKVDEVVELTADEKEKNKHIPVYSGKLCMVIEGDKCATSTFNLTNYILSSDKKTFTFKCYSANVGTIQGVHLKFEDKPGCVCNIKHIKVSRNKDVFEYDQNVILPHDEEVYLPEGSPRQTYEKVNKGKPAKLLLKLVGEKNSTDYFTLDDPSPGQNDTDEFVKISRDIGQIKNVHLKYLSSDKRKVFIESIEITNPRGETLSFPVEVSFKSGDESILPKSDSSNLTEGRNTTDRSEKTTSESMNFTSENTKNSYNSNESNQVHKSTIIEAEEPSKVSDSKSSKSTPVKQLSKTPSNEEKKASPTHSKKDSPEPDEKKASPTHSKKDSPVPDEKKASPTHSKKDSPVPDEKKASPTHNKKVSPSPEDKKASPTLQKSQSSSDEDASKDIEYTITTKTGNKLNAGTDSNVYIKINGDKKSTREMHLISESKKLFETGEKDTFKHIAENVGKIKNIEIRHDGQGLLAGWFLDSIEITNKYERLIFPVERWLAKDEGDGLCALTLVPGVKPPSDIGKQPEVLGNLVINVPDKADE